MKLGSYRGGVGDEVPETQGKQGWNADPRAHLGELQGWGLSDLPQRPVPGAGPVALWESWARTTCSRCASTGSKNKFH